MEEAAVSQVAAAGDVAVVERVSRGEGGQNGRGS